MAAKLMVPPVRQVLYATKMAQELNDIMANIKLPESPANAISEVRQQMNKTITNFKNLGKSQLQKAKEWTNITVGDSDKMQYGCCCTKHKFDRKLLHYERTIGNAESRLRTLQAASLASTNEIASALKDKAIAEAKRFADKEIRRIQREYQDQIDMYQKAVALVKTNYKPGGCSRKDIDYRCNCIDHKFEECQTLAKNIPKHIVKMGVQAPVPATVGMCVTNPIYSIVTLLINICTVLSMIIRLIKLILQIIEDIKYFFPFFDLKSLAALLKLQKDATDMMKDVNKQAKAAVDNQKNSLTPVYTLKYNKTTMKWGEDNLNGKIRGYKRPSKVNMSTEEIEGVEVITDVEIETYEMYNDALGTDMIGESVDGYIYDDGSIKSQATASVSITADGKHSILNLSDGRRITIDKIVGSGDVVKLNDGSIINIT
jgi:hypothetical protein